MAAAAIIAAKKVRAEALAREGAMTDDDIRELIAKERSRLNWTQLFIELLLRTLITILMHVAMHI